MEVWVGALDFASRSCEERFGFQVEIIMTID